MERSRKVITCLLAGKVIRVIKVIRGVGVASQLCKAVFVVLLLILPVRAEEPELVTPPDGVYALSLDDVTRLALMNNFDIQLAKYDAKIAQTGVDSAESIYDLLLKAGVTYRNDQSARTSTIAGTKELENTYTFGLSQKTPYGVTVDIDGGDTRTWTNSSFATLNPAHDSELKLTWRQDLGKNLLGIQDRGGVKLSLLDVENSEYTSLEKIEEQLAEVQRSYWELVLAIEAEDIEKEMVGQAKKLYDLHLEKIKDGLIESPELYASEANYRARSNDYLLARDMRLRKENTLKLLLNLSEEENIRIQPISSFNGLEEKHAKEVSFVNAFTNRRDYKRAANELKAKDITLAMNKNALWPEIDLEISFARNGVGPHLSNAFSDIGGEDNPDFFIGTSVTFPIQNREARADLKATEFEKAKAILNMKYLERKIAIDITDQVRNCNVLKDAAHNRTEIAVLQEKKFTEESKRFKYGRSDTDTMIRFQEDVIQAKLDAVRAQFNYYDSVLNLKLKEQSLLSEYWDEVL